MSHSAVPCEIIAIGNELLIGDVQDTNSHWLIQQLTGLGGDVRRVTVVRDEFGAIADALRASINARARLVITSGGLGPTADDLTLAAVGAALDLPMEHHTEALAMLTRRYVELARAGWVQSGEMNEARRKMALFPRGAEPLYNPVGGAPGASLRVVDSIIACLPGVPAELKGIFTQSMPPLLTEVFGSAAFEMRSLLVNCQDESYLAQRLQEVVARHPAVYIKSRARRFGPEIRIRVTLSCTARDAPSAGAHLDAAQTDLAAAMTLLGLTVEPTAD